MNSELDETAQGDQIGRIFACRAIVNDGQHFEISITM
jgi:hypothetical protein